MTSIYSCTDEYIQPYDTSIIPGATNIGLCDGTFVGHFQFFYDPDIYMILHDALVRPAPTDPVDGQDPPADDPTSSTDDPTTVDDPGAGGCSATGASSGGLVLVALGMLVTRRRRRR